MVKCIGFLRGNVDKGMFVKASCDMLNDIFKCTDNGFEELNKHVAEFSAVVDGIITKLYDSDYSVVDCAEAIVDDCYNFECASGINIMYLVSSMLDRVRVMNGVDFKKIDCVNLLCRTMESMGFIVNPTDKNGSVDTFSFSKDASISMGYLLECSFDRCFMNWEEFMLKFGEEFGKYQTELLNTSLSLWR